MRYLSLCRAKYLILFVSLQGQILLFICCCGEVSISRYFLCRDKDIFYIFGEESTETHTADSRACIYHHIWYMYVCIRIWTPHIYKCLVRQHQAAQQLWVTIIIFHQDTEDRAMISRPRTRLLIQRPRAESRLV